MDAKKIFNEHTPETQKYMQYILDELEKNYGRVEETWLMSLSLIADNYDMYNLAKKDLIDNGLQQKDAKGRTSKNYSSQVMNSTQQNLQKMLIQFGFTPIAQKRLGGLGGKKAKNKLENILKLS